VVGIGHELRGDDALGLIVARKLEGVAPHSARLLFVDAGPAPENITGRLRRFGPDLVILVDAVQMDAPPGTVACVPWQDATGFSASTHTLPLTLFAEYLTAELGCVVWLVGIQPASTLIGSPVSAPVRKAIDEVVGGLCASLAQAIGQTV
jgi:hydrogenase 3 maturation protease